MSWDICVFGGRWEGGREGGAPEGGTLSPLSVPGVWGPKEKVSLLLSSLPPSPGPGFDMMPNYVDSSPTGIVVSPWCSCRGSGNMEEECEKFLRDFTENTCLRKSCSTSQPRFSEAPWRWPRAVPSSSPGTWVWPVETSVWAPGESQQSRWWASLSFPREALRLCQVKVKVLVCYSDNCRQAPLGTALW